MSDLPHRHRGVLCALAVASVLVLAGCDRDTPQSLIESGKAYMAKRDHKGATIQFKTALQKDGQNNEARVLLGQALLEGGDSAGAELELAKALAQGAQAQQVVPLLARAMIANGGAKKLVATYGETTFTDKQANATLKTTVAAAWNALGEAAKSANALEAALASVPDFGPAMTLRARTVAARREFPEAMAILDRILARDGTLTEAWMLKGEILDFQDDIAGAAAAYRKALDADRTYGPAYSALIFMQLRKKDMAAAKAAATLLREAMPKNPLSTYMDAQVAFADRDVPKARELVQQVLRVAPDNAGVLQLAGAVEVEGGSLFAAETHLNKALQISPDLLSARRILARVYMRLGQHARVLQTVKPLIEGDKPDQDGLSLAGDAELRLGNAKAAEEYYLKAAKLSPDDNRLRTVLALARLKRGDAAGGLRELESVASSSTDLGADEALVSARVGRGDFDGALAALDAMDKKRPGTATTAELRGRVLAYRHEYTGARKAFDQALQLDPKLFAATSGLSAIDLVERKPEDAIKRLEASVKADPGNHLALLSLAELKVRTNAPVADIKQLYADAVKAAPQAPEPRLAQIQLLVSRRLYKEAQVAAQDAMTALPNDLNVLDTVGRAQMEAGDVEQALSTFRKLAGLEPNGARAYVLMANVYRASGRKAQAETALRKAIEVEPGMAPAQAALMDLLIGSGRPREALDYARKLQADVPRKATGYLIEAAFHERMKDTDAALAAYRNGASKADDSISARALYRLLLLAGRQADADRYATEWMASHAKDTDFELQLAMQHIAQGRLEQAEARLTHLAASHPGNAMVLNNLAWVMATRGRPGAVAMAQRAMGAAPGNALLMDTYALALASEKQLDKALTTQKQAVELLPGEPSLRLNLARLALQAGDKGLARTELQKLKDLGAKFTQQDEVDKLMKTL